MAIFVRYFSVWLKKIKFVIIRVFFNNSILSMLFIRITYFNDVMWQFRLYTTTTLNNTILKGIHTILIYILFCSFYFSEQVNKAASQQQ